MKYLKKLGYSFLYILITLLILTFLATIFNYFDVLNDKTMSIFKIIIPIISFLIGGYFMGKRSNKKGYMEGLKLGMFISLFMIIFNYLAFDNSFKLKYILFYIILIISSALGSMIGIRNNE